MTARCATDPLFKESDDASFLIMDIEKVSGVSFDQRDWEGWRTLGDIHGGFVKRGFEDERDGPCATAMMFYRVRRSIRDFSGVQTVEPSTPLAGLAGRNPRAFLNHISRRTGFMFAGSVTVGTWLTDTAWLLAAISVVLGLAGWFGEFNPLFPAAGICLLAGVLLAMLDPYRIAEGVTVRDLIERSAPLNTFSLNAMGSRVRAGDAWLFVQAMAAEASGEPLDTLTPETPVICARV